MTTALLGVPAIKADAASSAPRVGLRLVSVSDDVAVDHTASGGATSLPCLVLNSALGDKNIIDESTLFDLFQSLRPDERIELHHSVHRDEVGHAPAGLPYCLHVKVAAARALACLP